MSRPARTTSGTAIAALHERADTLALVILRTRARPGVLTARTFTRAQDAEIIAALSSAQVTRLVRVAPAKRTICRVVPVTAGSGEELSAAAALLGEGTLPEETPPHRRAAGILPGQSATTAAALLTAWRSGDDGIAEIPWPDQRWTTEIAALAFLSSCRGPSAAAFPEGGAVSILAPGIERTVARVLVESAGSPGAWDAAVARHIAQTCATVGIEPPPSSPARSLFLTDGAAAALRANIDGVPADKAWLDTYGIALGAALVAISTEPGAARLAELMPEPPSRRIPFPERAASWISVPRHAAAVIAVAIAALLLAPYGLAAARVAVLSGKAASLGDQKEAQARIQRRAALYSELEQVRWPMTKLLADISAATPEGVTVDAIRLAPDQGLSFQGNAESQEILNNLQKNLNGTGLFEKLKVARSETTDKGVSFDVSADIISPHTAVKPADDFAAKTLSERLYGPGAATASTGGGDRGSADTGARREGRNGRDDRSGDRTDRGGERRGRPGDTASARPAPRVVEVPPELTEPQIAALDRTKAMLEWSKRKGVVNSTQIDAPTKERIEREIAKLKDRMDSLKGGGGS